MPFNSPITTIKLLFNHLKKKFIKKDDELLLTPKNCDIKHTTFIIINE